MQNCSTATGAKGQIDLETYKNNLKEVLLTKVIGSFSHDLYGKLYNQLKAPSMIDHAMYIIPKLILSFSLISRFGGWKNSIGMPPMTRSDPIERGHLHDDTNTIM